MREVNVCTSIEIKVALESVANYVSNPDNAPQWYDNIKSAEWLTPKPLSIGSKIAFIAFFLGRKLSYTYEVIELDIDSKMVMKTAEGPFPMKTIYSWEKLSETSTKMSLSNTGKPSGFSKFMAPFMAMAMKKANQKDLIKLKRILENPAN